MGVGLPKSIRLRAMSIGKTAILFSLICSVALQVVGQSGRRPKPQATPATNLPSESVYSESRSYKPVRIYPPNYRNKEEDKKRPPVAEALPADEDVIKVDSTLVNIPVSIYDKNGLYISGIREAEFKIFEDGKEQEIAYFGTSDEPITVALLLDTSPSTQYRIEDIRAAAISFVRELNPEDSVMVVEFDNDVQVLSEPTHNRQEIYSAIMRADVGPGTALYDAVEITLERWFSKIDGRKAIVLFTDGVDTTSTKGDYGENLESAEEADAVIFPIYYNTLLENRTGGIGTPFPLPTGGVLNPQRQSRGSRPEDYAVGKQYLEDIAAYTGGRVYEAGTTALGLQTTFRAIAEELKRQYRLGYYPSDEGKPGERKKIKVRVYRPDLIVRARDSYLVGSS